MQLDKRKGKIKIFLIEYAGRNYCWHKIGRLLCWLVQLSAWLNWELGFPEFPSIYDSGLASAKRGSCVRLRSRSRKVSPSPSEGLIIISDKHRGSQWARLVLTSLLSSSSSGYIAAKQQPESPPHH